MRARRLCRRSRPARARPGGARPGTPATARPVARQPIESRGPHSQQMGDYRVCAGPRRRSDPRARRPPPVADGAARGLRRVLPPAPRPGRRCVPGQRHVERARRLPSPRSHRRGTAFQHTPGRSQLLESARDARAPRRAVAVPWPGRSRLRWRAVGRRSRRPGSPLLTAGSTRASNPARPGRRWPRARSGPATT